MISKLFNGKIKKTLFLIAFVILVFCPASACGVKDAGHAESSAETETYDVSETSGSEGTYNYSFQDDLQRTVVLQKKPSRVAVLIGSFADIWCLAGGKDSIVAAADDTWTSFDLDLPDSVVNSGRVKEPNAETILSADPDLIIASSHTSADLDLKDTFEQAGIPTAYFNVNTFDDYLHMLKICTDIMENPQNYEKYGTGIQAQVEDAREKANDALSHGADAPRCLYIRATASGITVKGSADNVLGEMLKDLGAVNIADSNTGLLENLSLENILTADPDFIFVVIQASSSEKQAEAEQILSESLTDDPAWSTLSAIKGKHYYVLDNSLYNLKPNARWGEAYQNLADILYGD